VLLIRINSVGKYKALSSFKIGKISANAEFLYQGINRKRRILFMDMPTLFS